jgi:acetylornithine deacetylase/succinyl-diaminopimelate desuccinylase-like protein
LIQEFGFRLASGRTAAATLFAGFLFLFLSLFLALAASPGWAGDEAFAARAPGDLSGYLKVDTINPPGNESRGVAYLGKLLEAHGIPFETGESAPGRGNLWARLKGGEKPGLVLLHHIDVVPADLAYWDFDPLSGEIRDGYVYGRGALDTKGLGIVQLEAFLALAASGAELNRDVWYVATADEEAGGEFGAGWMLEAHGDLFENVGYLINEGGGGVKMGEGVAIMVEVTQKVPLWLRLTAVGRPGHGSAPQVETSVTRLLAGADRIARSPFPARVVPPVGAMLRGMAPLQDESLAGAFADPEAAIQDADFMHELQLAAPQIHSLLRNTCSITRLEGSAKINVVPSEAWAELDCRLLPDQDPEAFLVALKAIIQDEHIRIDRIMGFTPAVSSAETELFGAIVEVSAKNFPDARVIPSVSGGFTDSHFFRDKGIVSYGYAPFVVDSAERRGVHGNNERISVENMERGTRVMIDLLRAMTVTH